MIAWVACESHCIKRQKVMNEQSECPKRDGDQSQKFIPLDAMTRVNRENGRWVVMLNVASWEPDENDEHPVTNNWKRINDYSTEEESNVAASWIEKSANRQTRPPTGF